MLTQFWERDLGLALCSDGTIYDRNLVDAEPHRLHVLLALMSQARAEWSERSRRSAGARRSDRQRQDQGKAVNHRTPWWIATDSNGRAIRDEAGNFQLDPVNAETIREMVRLFKSGLGGGMVAARLNEQKRPMRSNASTKRRGWGGVEVLKILSNPGICGTLIRKAGDLPGYYPPIEPAEFEELKRIRESRTFGRTILQGQHQTVQQLAQAISHCSHCGSSLAYMKAGAASNGNRAYLRCRRARARAQVPQQDVAAVPSF